MKGINLKNIGAIVAGATILASSVAYAGLMYQNTELVNSDGQPLAKVVLGANAMASDGVVAALISNKLANEAYKTTTFTAKTVGTPTCSGGASNGTGTCTVKDGSETVTLQITVPGAGLEGQHKFVNAIGDYVDRSLEDRYTDSENSDQAYTVYDDFEDADANPFQNYVGHGLTNSDFANVDTDTNPDDTALYDIGSGNFAPFADVTLANARLNKKYVEKQDFWTHGRVKWDDADHQLYGDVLFGSYTALLDSKGDYGIPVCPGKEELTTTHPWADCAGTTDSLPSYRVFVKFLGEDWVISEVDGIGGAVPTDVADKEVYQIDGSKVKLAKEAKYGIINVGETMETPNGYKIRLDDISRETGGENAHPAIVTVLDANGNTVCQDQVYPGETKQSLCDTPTGIKLHVYQTAPGLNFIAKWAEMAVYSDEIELESNKDFLDSSDTDWKVYLGWTNKNAATTHDDPEYLREIILYNWENNNDQMSAGDKFPVVDLSGYEAYDLTYNGIDDSKADYDTVDMKKYSNKQWTIQQENNTCTISASQGVDIKSSTGEFKVEGLIPSGYSEAKTVRGTEMWHLDDSSPSAITDDTCAYGGDDMVVIQDSTDNKKYLFYVDNGNEWLPVKYKQAGTNGFLTIYEGGGLPTPTGYDEFWLVEDAGKAPQTTYAPTPTTSSMDMVDGMGVEWDNDQGKLLSASAVDTPQKDYVQYAFAYQADLSDGNILYAVMDANCDGGHIMPIVSSDLGYESSIPYSSPCWEPQGDKTYEQGFIGMRGTQFVSGSDTAKKFKVPKNLLKASWTFSTVSNATMPADTHEYTLHEGESATVGTSGVSVKVLTIDEQLNPCTAGAGAGGAPTCGTPDMSTVSAVIQQTNAPSATGAVPYALTSNLVYLDTDNVALDTGIIITVGGDKVNTVTRDAIAGSAVDFAATPVVVQQIGNKIVVAGLNPEDTMAAGQQFVAALTKA